MKTEQKKTTLEIKYTRLSDSATYRVAIGSNPNVQDSRNFTLRIKDKPTVSAYIKPAVVRSEERFDVYCRIEAYPAPSEMTLLFRECPPQKPCDSSWTTIWNQTSTIPNMQRDLARNDDIIYVSHVDFQTQKLVVSGKARVSGQYSCKACNRLGCNLPDDAEIKAKLFVTELSGTKQFFQRPNSFFPNLTFCFSLYRKIERDERTGIDSVAFGTGGGREPAANVRRVAVQFQPTIDVDLHGRDGRETRRVDQPAAARG